MLFKNIINIQTRKNNNKKKINWFVYILKIVPRLKCRWSTLLTNFSLSPNKIGAKIFSIWNNFSHFYSSFSNFMQNSKFYSILDYLVYSHFLFAHTFQLIFYDHHQHLFDSLSRTDFAILLTDSRTALSQRS